MIAINNSCTRSKLVSHPNLTNWGKEQWLIRIAASCKDSQTARGAM